MEKIEIPDFEIKIRSTQINHRQQTKLQIMLPIILVILIMLSVAIFMILSSSANYSLSYRFANISIIFLILPTLIIAFLFGAIIVALCAGVIKIQEIIPKYSALADQYAKMITGKLQDIQDGVLEPVLLGKVIIFKISQFFQKIHILINHNLES